MKAAVWMTVLSLASWAAVSVFLDPSVRTAALAGLIGPLVVTVASWVVMERTYRQRPAAMTSVMVGGFGVKLLFVGGYVAVVLAGLRVRSTPFVVSFTGYFIALYVVEALLLRRLLGKGAPVPDRSQDL